MGISERTCCGSMCARSGTETPGRTSVESLLAEMPGLSRAGVTTVPGVHCQCLR